MLKLALSCLRVGSYPLGKQHLGFDQGGEEKLWEGIWGLIALYADFQPVLTFSNPFFTSPSEVSKIPASDLFESLG